MNAPVSTGKIFLIDTSLAEFQPEEQIALTLASLRFAATLLEDGRKPHSLFAFPHEMATNDNPKFKYENLYNKFVTL